MPKRFVVAVHPEVEEFVYPADPISLRKVKDAGGVSQLTPEERELIKFKSVKPGDDCSDLPEPALSIYLSRGWVVEEDAPVTPTPKGEVR